MKRAALLLTLLALAACTTLTPRQERALQITAAVLVAGAIAAHQADHRGGMDPAKGDGSFTGCATTVAPRSCK